MARQGKGTNQRKSSYRREPEIRSSVGDLFFSNSVLREGKEVIAYGGEPILGVSLKSRQCWFVRSFDRTLGACSVASGDERRRTYKAWSSLECVMRIVYLQGVEQYTWCWDGTTQGGARLQS